MAHAVLVTFPTMGWDESMFLREKFCAASCRLVVFSAVGQKAWKKTQTSEKESSQKTGTHISANEVVGAPVMWPGRALLKPSYIPCPPHIRFSACSVWAYVENFRYCGKIKYARKTISPLMSMYHTFSDCSLVKICSRKGSDSLLFERICDSPPIFKRFDRRLACCKPMWPTCSLI